MTATTRVSVLTGGTVLRLASLFAVTVFLGRSSGADALGSFSLLLAWAAILQSVSVGGLSGVAVHRLLIVGKDHDRAMILLIASRIFLIPLSFGLGGAALLYSQMANDVEPWALLVFVAGYAIGSFDVGELGNTARGHFLSMGVLRLVLIAVISIPKLLMAAAGDISALLLWQGIEAALWQLVLLPASGVKPRLLLAALQSFLGGMRQVWSLKSLWLSNIISALAQRVDLFIVGIMVGQVGVGQYSTASRPVEAAIIVANSLIAVLFNGMVGASHNPLGYAQSCRKNSRRVGLLAIAVTLVMAVAGPPILTFLYGSEFQEAAALLPIYSVSLLFLFQRQFLSRILVIEKAYHLSLISNTALLFSCIALNAALIPILGLTGAALAAVLSHPCSLLLGMMISRRGRQLLILSFGSLVMPEDSIHRVTRVAVLERQV